MYKSVTRVEKCSMEAPKKVWNYQKEFELK